MAFADHPLVRNFNAPDGYVALHIILCSPVFKPSVDFYFTSELGSRDSPLDFFFVQYRSTVQILPVTFNFQAAVKLKKGRAKIEQRKSIRQIHGNQ